ncbi:MAG TPA: hypothetical protein VH596_01460, partial [Terriglobales bacterium]
FGLKDVNELPSMEEFEKLVAESFQSDLLPEERDTEKTAELSTPQQSEENVDPRPVQVEAEKTA